MSESPSTESLNVLAAQIEQTVQLYAREGRDADVPAWVLPPASCDFLKDVVSILSPPVCAFEFGSGRSTHALRSVAARTVSVESSGEWLNQTEANSAVKEAGARSTVIPLRRVWNRLRLIESFDLERTPEDLKSLQESQLILVDSPPNPAKREHALYLALQHAPIGAIIVLDDLEVRAVNRYCSRLAKQNADAFRFWNLHIDHELGVFLKTRASRIRSRPALREFVGTWLRV